MLSLNRKLAGFSRHLLLLVVYALFFIVQLFFNLDLPRKTFVPSATINVENASGSKAGFRESTSKMPSKGKIRLNKRFQPSGAPVIGGCITSPAVQYVAKPALGSYVTPYYSSVVFLTHSLRGPPAVA